MLSTATCTCRRFTANSFHGSGNVTGGSTARTAAAVLGEVGDQRVHPIETRRVDELAAPSLLGDEAGMHQLMEVEGKRRRGNSQLVPDLPRRHPLRAPLDEQPVDGKPRLLRKRAERCNRLRGLHGMFLEESKARRNHISRTMESL